MFLFDMSMKSMMMMPRGCAASAAARSPPQPLDWCEKIFLRFRWPTVAPVSRRSWSWLRLVEYHVPARFQRHLAVQRAVDIVVDAVGCRRSAGSRCNSSIRGASRGTKSRRNSSIASVAPSRRARAAMSGLRRTRNTRTAAAGHRTRVRPAASALAARLDRRPEFVRNVETALQCFARGASAAVRMM